MILTRSQGQRLVQIIKLMRPDWSSNPVDKILSEANQGDGIPAHDFEHALRAAAHYATATEPNGGYLKRTPNLFVATGKHWDATAPANSSHTKAKMPPCEEHSTFEAHSCPCCWSDIKTGVRPDNMLGKRMTPATPANPAGAEAVKQALKTLQAAQH
ncbi:hypothetical protein ACTXM3_17200 [Glutamicibacter arilaitensis]|uniref:hypothetical protein n=2 Tax=Glutamicibacter arilaitensis TaxID=256701 RepID=UPI003FD50E48